MHLKDLEAGVVKGLTLAKNAVTALQTVRDAIGEADHQVTIVKELEKGTAIQAMAERIEDLEDELHKALQKGK